MSRQIRRLGGSLAGGEAVVWPSVVAALIVGGVSYAVTDRGDIRVDVALASMATFLFGVLLAFGIVRTASDSRSSRTWSRRGTRRCSRSTRWSRSSTRWTASGQRDLVDTHLTEQIDYRLVDYHLANGSFLELTDAVYALFPGTRSRRPSTRN